MRIAWPDQARIRDCEGVGARFARGTRLKALCEREGLVYLEYYTRMANAKGGLDPDLASDGVHPTAKGYGVMAPLAEKAIATALAR